MSTDHATTELTVTVSGTPVVPGVGYGPVVRPTPRPEVPAPTEIPAGERPAEVERFQAAVSKVADRLAARAKEQVGVAAEVLQATSALAQDRGLRSTVEASISKGVDGPNAMAQATDQFAAMFKQIGGLMAERVTDLGDIRDRVIAQLAGLPEPGIPSPEVPSVLLADDLAPADTAGLDPERVVAIGTRLGGPTSHTAIIARQLGIPCVVAVADLDKVATGQNALVDGATGQVELNPDPQDAARRVTEAIEARRASENWSGPGQTKDGHQVDILANVQDGNGARRAAQTPAEGVGLFRTELSFLDSDTEPTVDAQAAVYQEVLEAFPGKKVVIRTLDAGSDKPLKFAGPTHEENPALGVRGLRIAWGDPGLLTRQLDAIKQAATASGAEPWVMAPMVATLDEAKLVGDAVRERGLKPGVMIEIPAAALHAERILDHVDFLSIGTNDLTQYVMAADRLSADLASLTDPWQPALLQLVSQVAAAGKKKGKPVGVCGEAAADPYLACVLVGFGITSLSCAAAAVRGVGAQVGAVTLEQCQRAAQAVLETNSPAEARAVARDILQ